MQVVSRLLTSNNPKQSHHTQPMPGDSVERLGLEDWRTRILHTGMIGWVNNQDKSNRQSTNGLSLVCGD